MIILKLLEVLLRIQNVIELYAENSAGHDWTGKEFIVRTQPKS